MLHILRSNASRSFAQGPFKIRRVRPGAILGPGADSALGPFSVFDHANLAVGTVVRMHEHVNDEILSYMWRGTMVHEDSAGHRIPISPAKLMMMNAGKSFWHEESTPDVAVEMLQIFVRPREADLPGEVHFYDRPSDFNAGRWNLIAGPEASDAPLKFRQQVIVYDVHPKAGQELSLPTAGQMTPWLYVMDGTVSMGDVRLEKGDAVTDLERPLPELRAESDATVVLFLADRSAQASTAGTISGQ
jgi:redox-sensitive bicupin YhaK (pirin superfamily)